MLKYLELTVQEALKACACRMDYEKLMKTGAIDCMARNAAEDLISFSRKDPSANSDPLIILKTYTSYAATLHYRISNWVHQENDNGNRRFDPYLPAQISRRGKFLSGAEIHFRSQIGKRFILDHGFGTVIGETSIIGDDCYMLGGVTLGARGISDNPRRLRHPELGDRVQIGEFTAILGAIRIGNDVFIGPNCIISQDIPDGSKVRARSLIEITKSEPGNPSP
ncbi:MAG: serine O-acetyltransferase [Lautropia sp.]|nr:serine O-acetyltransferase [Lautropia sp.]